MRNFIFALFIGLLWAFFSCAPKVTPVTSVTDSTVHTGTYTALSLDTSKTVISERVTTETETPGDTLFRAFKLVNIGDLLLFETPAFKQVVKLEKDGKTSVLTVQKAKKVKEVAERVIISQAARISQETAQIKESTTHQTNTPGAPEKSGFKWLFLSLVYDILLLLLFIILVWLFRWRTKVTGYIKNMLSKYGFI